MPNVFGIVDGILIVGFDELGKDHDKMSEGTLGMQADKAVT